MTGSLLKEFHDHFYTRHILHLDETGNNFGKIASLWRDIAPPANVLDLGCGGGSVTEELVNRGYVVHGIDIQDEAVRRASLRGLQAQVLDLNQRLSFKNESFDVAIATDVIEHVYDPLTLLKEIRRVLKDSGYAIIILPQHFDVFQRFRMLFGKGIVTAEHLHYCSEYRSWNYVHIRLFTVRDCFELMRCAGFTIEEIEYSGVALSPYSFPARALLKLLFNRYSRSVFPSLLSSGVRMRVSKDSVQPGGGSGGNDSLGHRE